MRVLAGNAHAETAEVGDASAVPVVVGNAQTLSSSVRAVIRVSANEHGGTRFTCLGHGVTTKC